MDSDNNLVTSMVVGADASYNFLAECDSKYSIIGTKNEYTPDEKIVETPAETGNMDVPLQLDPIGCPPDDLGCRLQLLPIYFDYDRYNIRPDAEIELAKILAAMREYPQLVIHIESHTDSRGNNTYNELLSEKRAQSTLNWLVEKGVDQNRLSAMGYGENNLINECSDGVECTEEEHQLNRRSMFIIQN
jgi:outer membrane protein OmpA-like peptidoglycan-associated protein